MNKFVEKYNGFIGACDSYEDATSVIVGIPMDFTVSFRPGTRMGPSRIREVSDGIEEYSHHLDMDLTDFNYHDFGDVVLPFGNVDLSLERIRLVTESLLKDDKFPIMLGGEHLVTYPILQAFREKYSDLAVIQFDAHADLRENYQGEENSHATVMRKACGLFGGENIYQLGIRSGTKDEFTYGRKNTNLYPDQIIAPINDIIKKIGKRPTYITLDIDVVDPAFAPGTGTPEPGGCTSSELLRVLNQLRLLNVVGFDLVEVSPILDVGDCTSLLAAKVIRESILGFTKKK